MARAHPYDSSFTVTKQLHVDELSFDEGFVNKLMKRQGYGRANFDPLRARVLAD